MAPPPGPVRWIARLAGTGTGTGTGARALVPSGSGHRRRAANRQNLARDMGPGLAHIAGQVARARMVLPLARVAGRIVARAGYMPGWPGHRRHLTLVAWEPDQRPPPFAVPHRVAGHRLAVMQALRSHDSPVLAHRRAHGARVVLLPVEPAMTHEGLGPRWSAKPVRPDPACGSERRARVAVSPCVPARSPPPAMPPVPALAG